MNEYVDMLKINKNQGILGTTFVLILLSFLFPAPSKAAPCNFYASMTALSKNATNWTTTCTISGTDGVDNSSNSDTSTLNTASITLGIAVSGLPASITINNGGKLIAGAINFSGGNVAIQAGGTIEANSPVYVTDADDDGWAGNFTLYDASAAGRRRLSLMKSYTSADCNDAAYATTNTMSTFYRDADGDGYGNAAVTTSACTAPAGYVANNTDCYDGNANAKPGSTTCGTVNRGDGSFDYNCSGTNTLCGTTYNYATATVLWTGQHGTGSCTNNNATCRSNNINYYPTSSFGCGVTGALCSVQTWHEEGCGSCGASPNSQYRCTAITTGVQACQ